jgi:hypothetical protein
MSFPKTLSVNTAEDSKQGSNCNNPIETIDSHFDKDNELCKESSPIFANRETEYI